jgi:hypothetical protein
MVEHLRRNAALIVFSARPPESPKPGAPASQLSDHQSSAGRENPGHLVDRPLRIREETESGDGHDDVEGVVGEGDLLEVGAV